MKKYLFAIIIIISVSSSKFALSTQLHVFDNKLDIPSKCEYVVNNHTFSCYDIEVNEFPSTISFSKPKKMSSDFEGAKDLARTNLRKNAEILLDTLSSKISEKMHYLTIFKDENGSQSYDYSICEKNNCVTVFTNDMELIYSVFGPVADHFIFWNPVDDNS